MTITGSVFGSDVSIKDVRGGHDGHNEEKQGWQNTESKALLS